MKLLKSIIDSRYTDYALIVWVAVTFIYIIITNI
jgi:hypothetical protein